MTGTSLKGAGLVNAQFIGTAVEGADFTHAEVHEWGLIQGDDGKNTIGLSADVLKGVTVVNPERRY